ncbi:MAG TPA: ABC transporter substrate-binding protein, partial [Pirellulales bacterium]
MRTQFGRVSDMTDRCAARFLPEFQFLPILLILAAGCGGPPEKQQPAAKVERASDTAEGVTAEATAANSSEGDAGAKANPIKANADPAAPAAVKEEPFTPPASVAELDQKTEWEDRPVQSALKLFAEESAKTKPLVSLPEALRMKNDSMEANKKILSAFSRLPEGDQQPNWDASVTRCIIGDVNSLNPILVFSEIEFQVAAMYVFEPIAFDWNMIPFADSQYIERWQQSKDHMCDKLTLRRDCLWSDGKPITAEDIEYSYRMIENPKIPVLAVKTTADKLRDVKAYDDYTVVFYHREPLVTNQWDLDLPIIPKHVYEPLYSQLDKISFEELQQRPEYQDLELHPISAGPYDCVSRTRNQELVFRRREKWFMQNGKQVRDKPYFKEVRFRIVEDPNTALLALKLGGDDGGLDEYEIKQEQWATQTSGPDF